MMRLLAEGTRQVALGRSLQLPSLQRLAQHVEQLRDRRLWRLRQHRGKFQPARRVERCIQQGMHLHGRQAVEVIVRRLISLLHDGLQVTLHAAAPILTTAAARAGLVRCNGEFHHVHASTDQAGTRLTVSLPKMSSRFTATV